MAGDYTEITLIAPESAAKDAVTDVVIQVKNIHDVTIYIIPLLNVNGSVTEGSYEAVVPGATHSWSMNFIMPANNAVLVATSWCEDGFAWQSDDSIGQTVTVTSGTGGTLDINALIQPLITIMIVMMMMKMMTGTMGTMGKPAPPKLKPLYPGGPRPGEFIKV